MVFSSIPVYLDQDNWQQQQVIGSGGGSSSLFCPSVQQHAPPSHGGGSSIRPGSMAERARMANIPMPETALKCPRCDSLNTKFCYFNNYSLSQPRHFCRACRRYWTRGGALRSVPVGGGCRRNKRSKSSTRSKSPVIGDRQTTPISTASMSSNSTASAASLLGLTPHLPPLRFTSELNQYTDMGINDINFQPGRNFLAGGLGSLFPVTDGGGIEPWRLPPVQRFPFFSNLDPSPTGMNQFQVMETGFSGENSGQQMRPKLSSSMLTQMAGVKLEDNQELNLSKQLIEHGIAPRNDNQWINISGTNPSWSELSSNFSPFSTNN